MNHPTKPSSKGVSQAESLKGETPNIRIQSLAAGYPRDHAGRVGVSIALATAAPLLPSKVSSSTQPTPPEPHPRRPLSPLIRLKGPFLQLRDRPTQPVVALTAA
jgi:hypothetical protein